MTDFKISYKEALRIIEARDKEYADDIKTLTRLLKKRPIGSYLPAIGDIPSIRWSAYIADLYREQLKTRALECLKAEFMAHMTRVHPEIVSEE